MAGSRTGEITGHKHEMISGEIAGVADAHIFEKAAVTSKNIITTGSIELSLADLPPRLAVAIAFALLEV